MKMIKLDSKPTTVLEWEAADMMAEALGSEEYMSEADCNEIAKKISLNLPKDIFHKKLDDYAIETPLKEKITVDSSKLDIYFITVPVAIDMESFDTIEEEGLHLQRLRLILDLLPKEGMDPPIVPVFVQPTTECVEKLRATGEIGFDFAKALTAALHIPDDYLNFKITVPFAWKTKRLQMTTTAPGYNPIKWELADDAITGSFTGYAVIQTPKNIKPSVQATLEYQLVKRSLLVRKRPCTRISDPQMHYNL